jgi:hypothetical protein
LTNPCWLQLLRHRRAHIDSMDSRLRIWERSSQPLLKVCSTSTDVAKKIL